MWEVYISLVNVTKEMERMDVLGNSEVRWPGSETFLLVR